MQCKIACRIFVSGDSLNSISLFESVLCAPFAMCTPFELTLFLPGYFLESGPSGMLQHSTVLRSSDSGKRGGGGGGGRSLIE